MFEQVGIIGCGLIGCSFALAIKKAGIAKQVIGYSKSPTTTEEARAAGILDKTAASAMQAASGSDLILIAVPVGAMPQIFNEIVSLITPDTLIMDVGSTKQDVVQAAHDKLKKKISNFVPAHPIAGKNLAGHEAAEANLFENAKVVLTPLEETGRAHLEYAIKTWEAIGAHVQLMRPQEHDQALGYVSHLPHLLAFAYMTNILNKAEGEQLLSIASSGFRDFTRIAASDSTMWRDVFMANQSNLLEQITNFKTTLTQYENILKNENALMLQDLLQEASDARLTWGSQKEKNCSDQDDTEHGVYDEDEESPQKSGFFSRFFN